VIRKAAELKKPVAVNVSLGNNYGSHTGTSMLERYMDDAGRYWKSVICVGSGNEAAAAIHTSGILTEGQEKRISFSVGAYQPSMDLQIWKQYADDFLVRLILPDGSEIGPLTGYNRLQRFLVRNMEILGYVGEPSPYSVYQEIYFDLLPQENYLMSGVWQIVLTPVKIVDGRYNIWLPSDASLNEDTGFLEPQVYNTLTIPSTAEGVITVGAYDGRTDAYAPFSGRGRNGNKPTLAAPGVNVGAVSAAGGIRYYSGTSFATPIVTGSAALLMEWGIVRGNDPYLYGEKVKAYLQKGARRLPGFEQIPNAQTGYGALCLKDSIPV
jgi:subtilisin family serine protease